MTGPAAPAVGDKGAESEADAAKKTADEAKAKRDPLYADLPDDHPLVKRHEALKAENKELKPKAKIVDDAEAAKRTDGEKIAALQQQVDGIPKVVAAALRDHLVELHKIDPADAELFLTGDTPELVQRQVTALLEKSGSAPRRGNQVRREGAPPKGPSSDETREFVRVITDRGQ